MQGITRRKTRPTNRGLRLSGNSISIPDLMSEDSPHKSGIKTVYAKQ